MAQLKIPFTSRTVPLAILLLCLLSFGLLIPFLGLYWDDWPAIMTIRLFGVNEFWDFYRSERPFSAWTFIVTAPLLGTRPVVWHIFTLMVRWLTILGMWSTLRGLWRKHIREVTWMAFLFAIYPAFSQQPVAVAFSQHWICYALYFLSIAAMINAIRHPRWFWPLTLLAVFASTLEMLTMEYFIGLELLRPAILWFLLAERTTRNRRRLLSTLLHWSPYLIALISVIIWRLKFTTSLAEDPNQPTMIYALISQPFSTLSRLFQLSAQDLINNLIGSWYATMEPSQFNQVDRARLFTLLVGFLAAGLTIIFLRRLEPVQDQVTSQDKGWMRQALVIGLLAALLGPLPVWLTDRQALYGLYGSRFALAAMFGLSILVVLFLEWLTPRRLPKIILIGVLIGSSVGFHLRTATSYYRSTLEQNNFYWQLYWRAPHIQPRTAILSNDELFIYVGRISTSMALNLVYPLSSESPNLDYWFLELEQDVNQKAIPNFLQGKPLEETFRHYTFTGSSLETLAIYYTDPVGRCLWVLSSEDVENPILPTRLRSILPVSNLSRIEPTPLYANYPPVEFFGPEPEHTWCYYYQKADLARQFKDWLRVMSLWEQAQANGYLPNNPHEMLPFIEAEAHTGKWTAAFERTYTAFALDPEYGPRLCQLWNQIVANDTLPEEFLTRLDKIKIEMNCSVAK